MDWIPEIVRPGMVAVDVGANVGRVTTRLIRYTDQVYAIEPQRACCAALEAIPGVTVIQAAVSDSEGETRIYHSAETPHASLYPKNVLAPTGSHERVPLVTLDGLQAIGVLPPHVHVLKIDAQGADLAVLRGARQMLRTQHPVLFLEVWPEGLAIAGATLGDMTAFLESVGYDVDPRVWPVILDTVLQEYHKHSIDVLLGATACAA